MSVRFHPSAQAEARQAAIHYEREREGLGRRFRAALKRCVEGIEEWPTIGPRIDNDMIEEPLRAVPLLTFPYTVIYAVGKPVVVVAVAHQRRRPFYWKRRIDTE